MSKVIRIISYIVQIAKVIKARGQKQKPVRVVENSWEIYITRNEDTDMKMPSCKDGGFPIRSKMD